MPLRKNLERMIIPTCKNREGLIIPACFFALKYEHVSKKMKLMRMIYYQRELGRAWVCLPLRISLELRSGIFLREGKPRLSLLL